jgi:hypothetical protein
MNADEALAKIETIAHVIEHDGARRPDAATLREATEALRQNHIQILQSAIKGQGELIEERDQWMAGAKVWQADYIHALDQRDLCFKWAMRWKGYARRERIARQSLVQAQQAGQALLATPQRGEEE